MKPAIAISEAGFLLSGIARASCRKFRSAAMKKH